MGKFCGECGKSVKENENFCSNCGAKTENETHFCGNCGAKLGKNDAYCEKCGDKVDKSSITQKVNNTVSKNLNNIKSNVNQNVGAIRNNVNNQGTSQKSGLPVWAIILIVFFGLAFIGALFGESDTESSSSKKDTTNTQETSKEKTDNKKNDDSNLSSLGNVKDNFKTACKDINMDSAKVKDIKKIEDWYSGPRYTFSYEGHHFILYAYDNGNVSSIRIGSGVGTQIYLEGYEPYNVNDFLVEISEVAPIQVKSEEAVKTAMNYPNTANFNWITTGGYAKYKNIYVASAEVDGKNAFGVESTSKFYVELEKTDNSYTVVYMTIDDKVYKGTSSKMQLPERKEIKQETTEEKTDNSFVIKEGQKGTYGKEDLFDGEKYIRYYIPAGTYEVEALTKNASFFIETQKLHKEDGYDTATTIKKVVLAKVGDKDTIEIKSDQCLTMIMYSQVKFTKIN